ncbi:MAG: hypothetical protein WCG35_06060 [Betaproteobacteria bacterium]
MKYRIKAITTFLFSAIVITANVYAAEPKSNTLLYISPNDYNYSVHLSHPYYDYWFQQGPLIAPIALAALNEKLGDIELCKANEMANTIIKIKPHLFYNPQLRVYHSKLVATIYSGSGHLLGTYVGEAQQQGFTSVDMSIKFHLNKVYTSAMQQLLTKLQLNQLHDTSDGQAKLPCGMIGAQGEERVNFY